jgi:hypothetical protein
MLRPSLVPDDESVRTFKPVEYSTSQDNNIGYIGHNSIASRMQPTILATDTTHLSHFACPHCLTVLGVPVATAAHPGPCPCCGSLIIAPPALTGHQPLVSDYQSIAAPAAPQPFVAKRVLEPDTIKLEENDARKLELRRMRRQRSLYNACDKFLDSPWLRWGRRIATVLLIAFLVGTASYMKRHKWRPWWVAQDPRELELLKLREAKPSNSPTAPVEDLRSLPVISPAPLPNLSTDSISLTAPGSEPDPLDRAARLTSP